MTKLLNHIRKYCSTCLNCGSFAVHSGHLCGPCYANLQQRRIDEPVLTKPFPVHVLYQWTPGESDLLSRLVLSLKGSQTQTEWDFFARDFSKKYLHWTLNYEALCVVPAPSRDGRPDHAFQWAQSLSRNLGGQFAPCLRKVSQGHQRQADRAERALIEMELIENNTLKSIPRGRRLWVFADDIVTTGATARAAHIALGCPKDFVVAALAYRSLSCGASRDLLYHPND